MTSSTPMRIPLDPEEVPDFLSRALEILRDTHTQIYFDTSFLMWMTTIGLQSRNELTEWLDSECHGRLNVPVWSAHEYLHHHISKTISDALVAKTKKLKKLTSLYAELRPFMDEATSLGGKNPSEIRAAARTVFSGLSDLAENISQWKTQYASNAKSVLEFINSHTTRNTKVFEYMGTIRELGSGRYGGRMPPGFEDRRKKGDADRDIPPANEAGGMDLSTGSNRWGDLIFWKEILDHANSVPARRVAIITNDRKKDWFYARENIVSQESRSRRRRGGRKSVPCTHPLLLYEAHVSAGVSDVLLLDSPYLGEVLRSIPGARVSSFADVAIVSDFPSALSERARRKDLLAERVRGDGSRKSADSSSQEGADGPNVSFTMLALQRVLYESRGACPQRIRQLLDAARSNARDAPGANRLMSPETLKELSHGELVLLARELHDRVLAEEPGFKDLLFDSVVALNRLPFRTAGCLYLGFAASCYLERATNQPRLPPSNAMGAQLFSYQSAEFAEIPLSLLRRRIADADRWPVYMPNPEVPKIQVVMEVETDVDEPSQLVSLRISGAELLTRAQADPRLTLAGIFLTQSATGDQIVKRACDLFVIPYEQLERSDDLDRTFTFQTTTGLKAPRTVFVVNPESKT